MLIPQDPGTYAEGKVTSKAFAFVCCLSIMSIVFLNHQKQKEPNNMNMKHITTAEVQDPDTLENVTVTISKNMNTGKMQGFETSRRKTILVQTPPTEMSIRQKESVTPSGNMNPDLTHAPHMDNNEQELLLWLRDRGWKDRRVELGNSQTFYHPTTGQEIARKEFPCKNKSRFQVFVNHSIPRGE